MRDKLIELIKNRQDPCASGDCPFENDDVSPCGMCVEESLADYLIANGVTVQTTPIPYDRLLRLASKMHTWIFLNSFDEQKVYDELGITEEENYVFGYGGRIEMTLPEAPKEVEHG